MCGKEGLEETVLTVFPVVKQTAQGTRTRFKVIAAVGDHRGHVGLGIKCYKEVASAIRGAVSNAKLGMVQVMRGRWGQGSGGQGTSAAAANNKHIIISPPASWKEGTNAATAQNREDLHTVGGKATGESGSAKVRLMPAPHGVGIVGAQCSAQAHLLQLAGITDCFLVCSNACTTPSTGSVVKATLNALQSLSRLRIESQEDSDKIGSSPSSGGASGGNWMY